MWSSERKTADTTLCYVTGSKHLHTCIYEGEGLRVTVWQTTFKASPVYQQERETFKVERPSADPTDSLEVKPISVPPFIKADGHTIFLGNTVFI